MSVVLLSRVAGAIGSTASGCGPCGDLAHGRPLTTTTWKGGAHYRLALMMFFILCSTVGAPLSWHKTNGAVLRQLHAPSPHRTPKVDAPASDARTGIGGWFPRRDESGSTSVARLPWFSMESTLEAVSVFSQATAREVPGISRTRVTIVPTLTDNRGNGAALNKLTTTKFPASALLMELSCYIKKMSIRTIVEWVARVGNREADRLANGAFHDYDPALGFQSAEQSSVGDSSGSPRAGRAAESASRVPS